MLVKLRAAAVKALCHEEPFVRARSLSSGGSMSRKDYQGRLDCGCGC